MYRFIYIISGCGRISHKYCFIYLIHIYKQKPSTLAGLVHVICLDDQLEFSFIHEKRLNLFFKIPHKNIPLVSIVYISFYVHTKAKCRMNHDHEKSTAYSWMKLFPKRVSYI